MVCCVKTVELCRDQRIGGVHGLMSIKILGKKKKKRLSMIEKNFNRRAATRRMRVACVAHTRCMMSVACALHEHCMRAAPNSWRSCR